MTLYEMLDKTLYYQTVWIYEINAYDQNMPIFKGIVEEARRNTDRVWDYLMCEVDHYECNTGILLIKVKNVHFESKMDEHYMFSEKWGSEKESRPWRYSCEINRELCDVTKKETETLGISLRD